MMAGSCYVCRRPYGWRARPRWLFDHDANLIGTAHTGCTDPSKLPVGTQDCLWADEHSAEDAREYLIRWVLPKLERAAEQEQDESVAVFGPLGGEGA